MLGRLKKYGLLRFKMSHYRKAVIRARAPSKVCVVQRGCLGNRVRANSF